MIIFSLTQFDMDDLWPHLASVGGQEKVMPMSYYQLHVQTDYTSDIITQLMQFPLQHNWLFLLT